MNAIKSFFSKIINFFRSPKLDQALATVYDVLQTAMPIVEVIAAMTPNRTDDEIVAVIKQFAIPVVIPAQPMSDLEKTNYLKIAAFTAMKKLASNAGVPDSVVNTAVELAVLAIKNKA